MKNIASVLLVSVILACLYYSSISNTSTPTLPLDSDKATVMGIFDSLGDELDKDKKRDNEAFDTLVDVYSVIVEATNKTVGHPIHEIEDMEEFGTNLGVEVEEIAPDASKPLTDKQKARLANLFRETSKEIE